MLPVACFVTVFAGPVIRILLGAQWLQSAPLAKILVWAGVATALTEITGQMLIRQGKPQLATWSNLVKTLLLAGIFYPLLQAMHNEGIALALFAGSVVGLCIQLRYICLLLNARWREIGRTTIAGAVASLPFVAVRVVGDPAVMAYPVQAATGLASLATCAAVLLAFRGRIAAA
jgi:O-antigen/teichoic acid export membrane protein